MWPEKRTGSYVNLSRLFLNLWLFLSCWTHTVFGQCDYGLESACVWTHDPSTALRWQVKGDSRGPFVELSNCKYPDCGIGLIQSPWLPARDNEVAATIEYKIYGTSKVYLRVKLKLEDELPFQLFSKTASYAHKYPEDWTSGSFTIPATPTRYKLLIKAYTPFKEAMVAVKGINLGENIIITSTRSSSTSSTTTTKSAMPRTTLRSTTTTTTTTTTTVSPGDDDGERTSDDSDYFPDDDDDEDERRFQALEVQNFIGEEDLVKGCTTVVEPQICAFK